MEPGYRAQRINSTQKRAYSRKGCNECKKRKLKCDEGKPRCKQCIRCSKDCSYKQIAKFSKERTFTITEDVPSKTSRNERKHNRSVGGMDSSSTTQTLKKRESTFFELALNEDNKVYDKTRSDNVSKDGNCRDYLTDTNNKLHSKIFDQKMPEKSSNDNVTLVSTKDYDEVQQRMSPRALAKDCDEYSIHEMSLLNGACALTDGLNDSALFDFFDISKDASTEEFNEIPTKIGGNRVSNSGDDKIQDFISSSDLLPNHKNYSRLFYDKYSSWLMPFASGPNNVCNRTLMNLAMDFPFLLNAILSITARYENFCSSNSIDRYYQKYYFMACCKGFAEIFDDRTQISKFIEPLILTTLLLVTDAVAYVNGDWRAHLKAAHNLFSKYVDVYKKSSDTILLSAIWFGAFEILAVVSNPFGGSITSQMEFDTMMNVGFDWKQNGSAVKLGLTLPDGYNVFVGYSSEAIAMFATFVKLTLKIRKSFNQRVIFDDLALLFSKIHEANEYYLASKDCIITKDNPYHPNNETGMLLPIATYGYVEEIVFSWFDISHKLHVQALYLKILVDKSFLGLEVASGPVQDAVKEILSYCHFLKGIDFTKDFNIDEQLKEKTQDSFWSDRRLLTAHWPLLTCGICCVDKVDKCKIELYFKSLIQMGARSLERSFMNVKNKWDGGPGVSDYVPFV